MIRVLGLICFALFWSTLMVGQKFEWAKQVGSAGGSDEITSTVPSTNGVIVGGTFGGTIPDGTASANGGKDVFVRSTLRNGSSGFNALHFSSTGANDDLHDIDFYSNASIVTGKLDGTATVDKSVGTETSVFGAGSFFLAKVNSSGKADWMVPDTNRRISEGKSVSIDQSNGDIYIAGTFRDSLVLGANRVYALALNDIFVAKYNNSGAIQWLISVGSTGDDEVSEVIFNSGRVLLAGNFNRTLYFSPFDSLLPNTPGKYDVFAADINPSTGIVSSSARVFHSSGDIHVRDMVVLSNNNIAFGGGFSGSITNQGSTTYTSSGGEDIFIGTVNSTLTTAVAMKRYGGVLSERITNLEADTNLYAFGEFSSSTLSFGTNNATTNSAQDVFLATWSNALTEYSAHGGLMTLGSDVMSAKSMSIGQGRMYFGGQFRRRSKFGKVATFISNSVSFFDGYLASARAKEIFCPIEDSVVLASNYRMRNDTALLCFADSGLLTSLANSSFTFNWFDSIAPTVSIGTSSSLDAGQSGTYYAVITDGTKSCSDTSQSVKVLVEPEPINDIRDTIVCEGTAAFTMPMSPVYTILTGSLTGSAGIDPSTGRFFSAIAGIGADTIVYTYTDPNGCKGVDSASYTVQAKPIINFGTIPAFCEGDAADTLRFANATSSISIPVAYYSMTTPWGIKDSVIFRSDSLPPNAVPGHVVTFYAEDSIGCSNSRNANVVLNPKPNVQFNFAPPIPLCENTLPFQLTGGNQTGTYSGNSVNSANATYDPSLSISSIDTVYFSFTNTNGCTDSAMRSLLIDTVPIVSFSGTGKICTDDSLVELTTGRPDVNGSGTYTSPWVSSGDFFPRLAGVGTHPVTYSFEDNNGCKDSVTTDVKVFAIPGVALGTVPPICENEDSRLISGGSPAGGEYKLRGQLLVNDILDPSSFPALPGGAQDSMFYHYTDTNGCSSFASREIIIRRLDGLVFNPELNLNRLCNNDSIDLFAMGDTLFSPPPATGGKFLDEFGNFISVFKGSNYLPLDADTGKLSEVKYIYDYSTTGCSDTLSRFIRLSYSPTASIKATRGACAGVNLTIEAEGGITYVWDNDSIGNTRQILQDSTTKYFVTATNVNGCSDSASIVVEMSDGSIITGNNISETIKKGTDISLDILDAYSSDTVELIGSITTLNEPGNADEFTVDPGIKAGVMSSLYYRPNIDFRRQDTIAYQVCDIVCINVCDTAEVVIRVLGDPYDFMPNGFSPNGDGMNDTWVVPGIEAYPNNELFIYNRWGDLIYEAAPYNNEWAGQANKGIGGTEKIGDGIFYYVLFTNDGDPIKGSIEMKSK